MSVAPMMLLRADADGRIGTGHVMRCLALGEAWQAAGGEITFMSHCRAPKLSARIRSCGAQRIPVQRPHPNPADREALLRWLRRAPTGARSAAPWVVLDGYHFDSDYERAVRAAGARLLVIDDMAQRPRRHAELLVNQNLGAERLEYPCDAETFHLLGCRYAMLRSEFRAAGRFRRKTPQIARKLLVTLGGADPANVTRTVLEALDRLDIPDVQAKVVVGPANPHLESLGARLSGASVDVELLTDVSDMSELMVWADLAIGAAGSTCWEMAAKRLPAVVVVVAENQRGLAEELSASGMATCLGRAEDLSSGRLANVLAEICRDRNRRARQSEVGGQAVDGHGAGRVVAMMRAMGGVLPKHELTVRPADAQDVLSIWRLANDPTVRRHSLSTAPIPLAVHRQWFQRKLSDAATCMWVLDLHRTVVGTVRYDRTEPGAAGISIQVAAALRRRGLASHLLRSTCQAACRTLNTPVLRAVIRPQNLASAQTFAKAGFHQVDHRPVHGQDCRIFERAA